MKTVLGNMPDGNIPARLRLETSRLFLSLPTMQQTELLGWQWKKIAGLEMIPALRQIYDSAPAGIYRASPLVASAVERLYELDPAQGRALLVEDMKRPYPRLPFQTLAILSDATLPEMDGLWSEQMAGNSGNINTELIARYGTSAISNGAEALYGKRICDAALVAYLLRVDPITGRRILDNELAKRNDTKNRCWLGMLGRIPVYSASPEWEKRAVLALEDPSVAVKEDAVRALSRYGSSASKAGVWAAFAYWHEWWKDRAGELNEENRRFEQVFVESFARAKNWDITRENFARIGDNCITDYCRSTAEEYRRNWKPNGS